MDVDDNDELQGGEESVEESVEESLEESSEVSAKDESNKGVKRKSEFQVVYCSICNVSSNSSTQATAHYSGKSHQHKVRTQSSIPPAATSTTDSAPISNPPPESLKCELCHRSFNSDTQLHAHMTGKAHQTLAKSKLDSFGITALPAADQKPVISSNGAITDPKGPPSSFGSNLTRVFHCAMCDITLNSQTQMEQHNKGLRHKIVIGKAKPPTVAGEKWENVRFMKISNAVLGTNKDTLTGSGGGMNLRQFYCEKCDLTVNSQIQLDQHLESQKHLTKGMESTSGTYKRKRGAAIGRVGRLAGQGYHYNNTQAHYGARHKVTKPYLPPLSMNFIRSSKPSYDNVNGIYSEHESLPIMGQFGAAEDVSQNWNSNFIYDMQPSHNLAMY